MSKQTKMSPQAVANVKRYIKSKGFTHIKVELEGELKRQRRSTTCPDCQGRGQDSDHDCFRGRVRCHDCDGDGYIACSECDGDGYYYDDDDNHVDCGYCSESGRVDCEYCDGLGNLACEQCRQDGQLCNTCDGSGVLPLKEGQKDLSNNNDAKQALRDNLSEEGRKAIVYDKLYHDGGDTEYTFTIAVENAHLLPEFVQAYKDLKKHTGFLGVDKAGMHMSVMSGGSYPDLPDLDIDYLNNFKEQVQRLLPALYVYASPNLRSRPLGYRKPQISSRDKYSAIKIGQGHIEYRLFETCYEKPEHILTNLAVIGKTLKYYGADKLPKKEFYGKMILRDGTGIHTLFDTPEKRKALDMGLQQLLPAHMTLEQLRQRVTPDQRKDLLRQAKLKDKYQDYLTQIEKDKKHRIKMKIKQYMPNKAMRNMYDIQLNPEKLRHQIKQWTAEMDREFRVLDFDNWLAAYGPAGKEYTIVEKREVPKTASTQAYFEPITFNQGYWS